MLKKRPILLVSLLFAFILNINKPTLAQSSGSKKYGRKWYDIYDDPHFVGSMGYTYQNMGFYELGAKYLGRIEVANRQVYPEIFRYDHALTIGMSPSPDKAIINPTISTGFVLFIFAAKGGFTYLTDFSDNDLRFNHSYGIDHNDKIQIFYTRSYSMTGGKLNSSLSKNAFNITLTTDFFKDLARTIDERKKKKQSSK